MSANSDSLDGQIRSRASELLEGSEAVCTAIIQREFAEGGANPITNQAYAVKSRIKNYSSIVRKVKDKRSEKKYIQRADGSETLFEVDDLTDLVGVRVVTLYRSQIVEVIRSFLNILGRSEGILFAENIKEIIVYSTDPEGDPQQLVKHIQNAFEASTYEFDVQVYSRPSKYSSIHIVVNAVQEDNIRGFIPVELQIRTAFEDVWSEIEHTLKYKREEKKEHNAYSTSDHDAFESSDRQLNILKSIIDGAAQHADEIKFQIDKLTEALADASDAKQYEDSLPAVIAQLEHLKASPDVLRLAETTLKRHGSAISQEFSQTAQDTRRTELEEARVGLQKLLSCVRKHYDGSDDRTQRTLYLIQMELGLCLTELGRERNEVGLFYEALATYGQIYRELSSQVEPAIFRYRRARVLDLLGDDELALELFEKVYADNLENVPRGHWLRFAVCRSLGYMYWERADHLRRISEISNMEDFEINRRKKLLYQACEVTAYLMDEEPDLKFFSDQESADREPVRIINNLLYFVIEFLDMNCDWNSLASLSIDDKRVESWIATLENSHEKSLEQEVRQLDTLRRALSFVGNYDQALEKARSSVKILQRIQNMRPLSSVEEDMMKEAVDFENQR